jgi:hypothetical protein
MRENLSLASNLQDPHAGDTMRAIDGLALGAGEGSALSAGDVCGSLRVSPAEAAWRRRDSAMCCFEAGIRTPRHQSSPLSLTVLSTSWREPTLSSWSGRLNFLRQVSSRTPSTETAPPLYSMRRFSTDQATFIGNGTVGCHVWKSTLQDIQGAASSSHRSRRGSIGDTLG